MAVTQTDRLIALGVERARDAADLTQQDLIELLARQDLGEGVRMSRSHYANVVAGQAAFTAQHLAVLTSLLDLDAICRAAIWRRWGLLPTVAAPESWAHAADRIGRRILDPPSMQQAEVPDAHVASIADHLRESSQDVIVVRGGWRNVYSVVVSALRLAREGLVLGDQMIHVLGFGKVGLRPRDAEVPTPRPGLHPAIRRELVKSMDAGWHCRHSIHPGEVRSSEPAALVRMIAPMLRHGRYEARLLATDMPLTTAGLIIIGNYAALDFYATSATGEIDSVIVHRNAPAIQMLRDYAERLSEVQIPLYSRYERVRSEQKPVMADGERQFRQELLEVSKIGDRVDFMLLRVPNPLLPVDVYERALTARASVANAVSPDDGVGQLRPPFDTRHPARAHSKRADTLVEQLERWERQLTNEAGIASRQRRKSAGTINPGCRVVLGRSTMIELAGDGAVAGSAAWRRLTGPEIVSIIDNLVTLVRRFPHALQFAIVDESELPPIASDDRARWEIRSFLTGGGKVMFQMDTGEGTDELERRIHLGFEDDDVVRAFREFTDKICDEKSPHVLLGEEAVRFLDVDLRSLAVARSPVVTNAV